MTTHNIIAIISTIKQRMLQIPLSLHNLNKAAELQTQCINTFLTKSTV